MFRRLWKQGRQSQTLCITYMQNLKELTSQKQIEWWLPGAGVVGLGGGRDVGHTNLSQKMNNVQLKVAKIVDLKCSYHKKEMRMTDGGVT